MSSVITPVSEYDTSSALTVPSNGDDLDAFDALPGECSPTTSLSNGPVA